MMRLLFSILVPVFIGCLLLSSVSAQSTLVEAGMPALSRAWAGDDYAQAASVLAAGKVPLPQLTEGQGQVFLQRITSTENLSLCRNNTLPLEQRIDYCLGILGGVTTIAKQYMAATSKGLNIHREIAMQLGFMLRTAAVGVQLVNESLSTVPKDDKYPIRMDGLKKVNAGLTTMFAGAVTSLTEKNFYSSEDFSLLLDAMAETLPDMKKSFAPDYLIELRKKLEADQTMFPKPHDTQDIQRMLDELKG